MLIGCHVKAADYHRLVSDYVMSSK